MTRWLIKIETHNADWHSRVLSLLRYAAKLGLQYTISSKEVKDKNDGQ